MSYLSRTVCFALTVLGALLPPARAGAQDAAGRVTIRKLEWPWAWGDDACELHMIRLRFDAGEKVARAYASVGRVAGQDLALRLTLGGPGRTAFGTEEPVQPAARYALDFSIDGPPGGYRLNAELVADGAKLHEASQSFVKCVHPAAISPPERGSVELLFSESEGRSRDTPLWPVSVGVPFPRGALLSVEQLRVVGPVGQPVRCQIQPLYRWYRDALDVKWVNVQFLAELTPGQRNYRVEFGTEVRPTTTRGAPQLAERAKRFAQTWIREGAYIVRGDGREFRAVYDPECRVEIEGAGPVSATAKTTGRYMNEQGDVFCRFENRLTVFLDMAPVRLYFTLVWTEHSQPTARDVGIRVPAGFSAAEVDAGGLGRHPVRAGEGIMLIQDQPTHCRLASKRGGEQRNLADDEEAPGYLVLRGEAKRAAAFMRDMDRNLPTELEAQRDGFVLHLWAGDEKPLSWKVEDVVTPMVREFYGGKVGNSYRTGGALNTSDDTEKSPFGVAKTLEFWVLPADGEGDPKVINEMVQEPLVLLPDPAWTARTQVWGPFHPYDPTRFGDVEDSLELAFDWLTRLRPEYGDYDWFNYGDVHMSYSGSYVKNTPYAPMFEKEGVAFSAYRGWACSGYDWPTATWLQFARTGKRKYFAHGEANARHVMDIDTCHESADPSTDRSQWKKRKGEQYEYGCVHWTYGPIELTFYTHVDFMVFAHCMLGYERAKDVLDEVAECVGSYWRVAGNREVTNPPKVLCRLYEMTGEEQFLYMAQRFIQFNLRERIGTGELYVYPGLFYYASLTGRPEATELLLHYADRSVPPVPAWDRQAAPGGNPFEATAYAYWLTGDARYLQYADDLLDTFSDGVQRDGNPAMRGLVGAKLPVIELGPMIRGMPALLSALSRERGKYRGLEASNLAVLELLPTEVSAGFDGYEHVSRVYLFEEADQPFVVDNPYRMSFGNTGGELLMRLLSPSARVVAEKGVVSEALRSEGTLRLDVPKDGEAGQYELQLLFNPDSSASRGNSFLRVRTSLGKVMYDATGEIQALYGQGRLWFHVPEGTRQFALHFRIYTGGGVVLRGPDGERIAGIAWNTAEPGRFPEVDPFRVDVPPGKAGRWWSLSFGWQSWPPLYVRFEGIPGHVAVRKDERFVVKSME